jgi:hypothetical protein
LSIASRSSCTEKLGIAKREQKEKLKIKKYNIIANSIDQQKISFVIFVLLTVEFVF